MAEYQKEEVYGTICINDLNEVLLVKGKKAQKWSFPKGHLKRDEKELVCAKRELYEETGVMLKDNYVACHKMHAGTYYVFQMKEMPCLEIQDDREIDAVTWWPIHELPGADANVDVSILRTLMKSIRKNQCVFDFLKSPFVHKRITSIKESIRSRPRNIPNSPPTMCGEQEEIAAARMVVVN